MAILRAIRNAQAWSDMIDNGKASNVTDLAKRLGFKSAYVTWILSLNNLAPDIIQAIYDGTEPEGISLENLVKNPIPDDWNEQRRQFGFC